VNELEYIFLWLFYSWKVLNLQNREATKDSVDSRSSNSSKISFVWDVRSCSSASSVYTNRADQMLVKTFSNMHSKFSNLSSSLNSSEPDQANKTNSTQSVECVRIAQWITTDTDCKFTFCMDLSVFFFSGFSFLPDQHDHFGFTDALTDLLMNSLKKKLMKLNYTPHEPHCI
jgi:hypothetical protein